MIKKVMYMIFAIGGIGFSIYLIYNEIQTPGYCPTFLVVPACYLVLAAFILTTLGGFQGKTMAIRIFGYMGIALGTILALWFSTYEIIGAKHCPELFSIPLCFVSLGIFAILLFLRIRIDLTEQDG